MTCDQQYRDCKHHDNFHKLQRSLNYNTNYLSKHVHAHATSVTHAREAETAEVGEAGEAGARSRLYCDDLSGYL